jgi:pyroglutamyl-peptidase
LTRQQQANKNAPYGNAASNPAGEIAKIMPSSLAASNPFNTTGTDITILDGIQGGWAAIEGSYDTIRRTLKTLHEDYGNKVDLWIHLGRGPWDHVTCERRAYRQDFTSSWLTEQAYEGYYLGPDNEKQSVADLGPCPWMNVPMGLNSEIDINTVVVSANAGLKTAAQQHEAGEESTAQTPLEVKSHVEAGNAGCGFAFYESLANCFAMGRKRDILFVHVPRQETPAALEKGRDAVLAIVGASIASIMTRARAPPADFKTEFSKEL